MIDVEVCLGSACFVKGSHQIVTIVKKMIEENNWEEKVCIKGAFCMGKCSEKGVGVKINGENISNIGIYNAGEELEFRIKELVNG
jgi:NADH-quinone oxidoreductase subunit G